ncbi:sphingolipid C4-hydroxylase SUR2 [Kluyveromyces marxianus]|uniref:Sphingolipid C4-hydroxylase SUR2 n=1 Tax=Kluyveromyces marxianus TaxID=4911 RepID=A0ABX6ESY0_KLUMA|nr:sphingolipid C4-hydroxylase SUR2 [Kluyveromyces marxianus]BAP71209.1 sphingolipid C4-hydroxylase SUR2 [Kluyveromyces marxianus]
MSSVKSDFGTQLYQRINDALDVSFMASKDAPVAVITKKPDIFDWISDGKLALALPVVVYWAYSMFFHVIDTFELCEKYRIHPSEEVQKRNQASRTEVLREVLFQHLIQTVVGLTMLHFDPVPTTGFELLEMWKWRQTLPSFVPSLLIKFVYCYGFSILKIFTGFCIVDSWQYWLHRLMHENKELYKRFHSRHHRLYVPYAYGALYNSPVEGFLLDTLGTGIAALVTKLTHTEQVVLYTFATLKTVDDHCGYALPLDPFQWLFPNNAVYHDIHHQSFGIKSNFSQPFFTLWDTVCRTKFHGFEEYEQKQRRVTIDKYKEFLEKRKIENEERLKNLKKKMS